MKIYKNPWVTRESYFIKTGAARSAKMEAAKSTGYSVDFWDGKWKVRKATYYNKSLAEMPVVCENRVSIQAVIGKAVLDAVRGFAGGGKSDGEETPDVAPVVRCKDCKHYRNHPNGLCYLHTEPKENARGHSGNAVCVEPEDFCSYGERKDGGAK